MPKISVIMGLYNTKNKAYLKKSLNSILNQTYKDFELIICDDGSTNDCMKWAKEICKDDTRVIFIKNEINRGLSYTLNHCLKVAKGKYIARMDDDDESRSDRFEVQIKYLEQHPNIDLVSSNMSLFNDNGVYGEEKYPEIIHKKDFLFNSPIVHPAIMAKRKCFDIVSGYSESKYCVRVEDYDLFMRMFAAGVKMRVIQDNIFSYRADELTQKRRKVFKYRINESIIRFKNYFSLKLYPIGFIYVFKPIFLGMLPTNIVRFIKERFNKR